MAAATKRPALPLVLTANELVDGVVVYFDGAGWSPEPAAALVARDEEGAALLEAALATSEPRVVEPFLATVDLDAEGRAIPIHYRDRIRVSGPTAGSHAERVANAGVF